MDGVNGALGPAAVASVRELETGLALPKNQVIEAQAA